MALTNAEYQRRFKARKYADGFRQTILWLQPKRKNSKMDRGAFIAKLDKLTADWTEISLSKLFVLFIRIVESRKEVTRLRKKRKT